MALEDTSPLDGIVKKMQRKRFSEKAQTLKEKLSNELVNILVECGKL